MPLIPTSPTVVFIEKDNSSYPANVDSSIVGIVGFASKGPTDTPTLITSQQNLIDTFGNPSEDIAGQGLEGALEILETTNQIRYVRAIPGDAKQASAAVELGVCPTVKFAASGFGVDYSALNLTVSVWDSKGVKVLDNQTYTIPSGVATAAQGQAFALASRIGDGSYATDPVFVAISGTDAYLINSYAGKYSQLSVTAQVSAFQPVDLTNGNYADTFASSLSVSGYSIHPSSVAFGVEALYPGTGYNLKVDSITNKTLGNSIEINTDGGAYSLLTVNYEGAAAESYKVSLLNDSSFAEDSLGIGVDSKISDFVYGNFVSGSTVLGDITKQESIFDKITTTIGAAGVTVINFNGSETESATPRFVKFIDSTYSLANGTNGTMSDGNPNDGDANAASAIIGSAANKTGIHALDDDILNISLAIVPGLPDQRIQNELITLAETSQNFLAVVSPPMGFDKVQEAIDWMNGKDGVRTAAINNSWAAVYWPWVQVFDVFSAKDRWYDPAIFAVRQLVFTDNVADPWFAAAGFRRGRLTKPTSVEVPLNQGDRDALYVNNINPIVNFAPEGITIFGQKTAQRLATALDRVNIRRLMIVIRKILLQTGRIDLFEPNDEFTWEQVKSKTEAVLGDIKTRRGITAYQVICDSTVNTPVRVDRNELWCKVLLKPTKTAEWVIFEVNLTNQDAKFSG